MPVCIYCVTDKPASAFTKSEHVLPKAFGRFRDNLTLHDTVCDECNEFFGKTLDRYLARDTPDGFNRFRLGYLPPEEYKSLGKASTMTHTIAEGPRAGAFVKQVPHEGEMAVELLPQVGFGLSPTGPFKWFLVSALPSREQLNELFQTNHRQVLTVAVEDTEAVLKELAARGMQYEDTNTPPPTGVGTPNPRIETKAIISDHFGRALAKISLNYLASQLGAGTALMPQFNTVRECVRWEKTLPLGSWAPEAALPGGVKHGHVLALMWNAAAGTVTARIAFHSWKAYRVVLANGGFLVNPPSHYRAHFYNLTTRTVEPFRRIVDPLQS